MRLAAKLRTADVLAAFASGATRRQRDVAAELGVKAQAVSGHLYYLRQRGQLERVGTGLYRIPAKPEAA